MAGLQFAHRVLTETPVLTKVDARKQHATFKCMEKPLIEFREKLEVLRDSNKEEETMPNGSKRFIIPEAKRKAFEEKVVDLENARVDVDFDYESFSVLSTAFDGLFTRQQALKEKGESEGISNETTMKMIEELASSLEGASEVK